LTDAINTQIIRNFPRLKAVVYYNSTDETNNSGSVIESSAMSTNAFKNAISNPAYAQNTLGNLPAGTKIRPLGSTTVTPIPGDADGNRIVDIPDLNIVIGNYSKLLTNGQTVGDFNNDGKVNGVDFAIWLKNYRP